MTQKDAEQAVAAKRAARLFLRRAGMMARRGTKLSEVRAMYEAATRTMLAAAEAAYTLRDELDRRERQRRAKELNIRAKRNLKALAKED